MPNCCPIVELRQYTLHRNRRDDLIELFERKFVESQEALGMRLIGQFRDLDDPDRYVWMRGFETMEARTEALAAFYGGPIWKAGSAAANATMLDSDNVLILKPAQAGGGFSMLPDRAPGEVPGRAGVITASIHYLDASASIAFAEFFASTIRPELEDAKIPVLATFVTEATENTFPGLPVREKEPVFVWFTRAAGATEAERVRAAVFELLRDWREAAPPDVLRQFARKPEVLRLAPASRSLLR